ncbi:hypothetical protein P7K49_013807, partial [Saguinus oedipus]
THRPPPSGPEPQSPRQPVPPGPRIPADCGGRGPGNPRTPGARRELDASASVLSGRAEVVGADAERPDRGKKP